MKDKQCPMKCGGRAKIKPLLDPYRKTNTKSRLRLYDWACSTKGCYLEQGAGFYVEKDNINQLETMWEGIPDYVEKKAVIKKPKIVKKVVKKPVSKKTGKTYTIHFSVSGKKDKVQCSSRKNARVWSNDVHEVNCPRCMRSEAVQFLLTHKEVS